MVNVPFYKYISVKNQFLEKGHTIKYLPPYSPMLNPIENSFSKWKLYVKMAYCTSEDELIKPMGHGFKTITKTP